MSQASNVLVEKAYQLAKERYASWGIDTEKVLTRLQSISISMQCWQGDDVGGFESSGGLSGGGILATGAYPGKARTPSELRADADMAFRLIPGKHRFNLHAIYLESGGVRVERDEIEPNHFRGWMDWAAERGLGLDFNPTFFSHPLAASGFTLTHPDDGVRRFWVRHGQACRRIGEAFGRHLGKPCVTNIWIPDGMKDLPADRKRPRERLVRSLDEILSVPMDPAYHRDAVEGKLFGIGSEAYVAGSHEFYLGYAITRKTLLCLDSGHFHPTESVADKISSVLLFTEGLLLHVSRGIRWDSDHVVILGDEVQAIANELVAGDYLGRVFIGLDFFDASINRIAAWVIGMRAMLKALLAALLTPWDHLREFEDSMNYTGRLVLMEAVKTLPMSAVWDYYCLKHDVPLDDAFLSDILRYENEVLSKRGH
ncbi:MAG TPA: L-rhamnose isomerase [Thermogutta sp.]|nr:L-rhamnose isomerase [Thermogutta sp.]HPU04963.1 L-rhamnose isomerase [Thermogutta sp.]HQF12427.1 L-rhamnose isomerase [Thermogutta sp.]